MNKANVFLLVVVSSLLTYISTATQPAGIMLTSSSNGPTVLLPEEPLILPVAGPSNVSYNVLEMVDFDQDGYDDILALKQFNSSNGRVAVLLNQSGVGFIEVWASQANASFNSLGATTGDVNGDGWTDVLALNQSLPNTPPLYSQVYLNQMPNIPVCAADLDKTGTVDYSDLLFVLTSWGDCGSQFH
jgi:hypothetical protein